jgi:hypothetical protein
MNIVDLVWLSVPLRDNETYNTLHAPNTGLTGIQFTTFKTVCIKAHAAVWKDILLSGKTYILNGSQKMLSFLSFSTYIYKKYVQTYLHISFHKNFI